MSTICHAGPGDCSKNMDQSGTVELLKPLQATNSEHIEHNLLFSAYKYDICYKKKKANMQRKVQQT